MEKIKPKTIISFVVLLISLFFFRIVFRNWDLIKEFINNLF
jgi:hypothetical protein